MSEIPPPLVSLIDILRLTLSQARAYEAIIPSSNYPARAAVAVLGELAQQAMNEAEVLVEQFEAPRADQAPFSPREFQVLRLVAHGLTNKEIAYRLAISERTVQFHLNSIFNKTGTNSRTEAVSMALLHHWLVAADLA